MLEAAYLKRAALSDMERNCLSFIKGRSSRLISTLGIQTRLLRYKTTRYLPHEQRAEIRFLYDKFPEGDRVDRYVSDFDCHVYYPREVELLYRVTGFSWRDGSATTLSGHFALRAVVDRHRS